MKKLLTLLLLLISFTGFAQQKEKDPFIGLDKKDIIQKYGKPTTIKRDSKGEILIYKKEYMATSVTSPGATAAGGTAMAKRQLYTFYVDKKGKVYSWKVGDNARSDHSPVVL